MWYQILSYLKFLSRSTHLHGVHSPFVYDLVTRCFKDKQPYEAYGRLETYRSKLFKDDEFIEVTDFGAGSRVFRSNTRKVSAIARYAGITRKRQRLLFRLVRYFQPGSVLELGTSVGLSTAAIAMGNPKARVVSIEGCENTLARATGFFREFQLKNIIAKNTGFDNFLSENTSDWDLVFIDGNHNKEKTLEYFEILKNRMGNQGLILLDDIYLSPSMTRAWRSIIDDEMVTVSIDTFHWGLVFFRREQKKQHFNILM